MKTPRSYTQSRVLQEKAHRLIPGGCHTYAKGDDQFPEGAPGFIARGEGCRVWDVDGNEFIEYGMGLRAVGLGHAYRPVVEAAYQQMQLGNNFTRPAPVEVTCAEKLLEIIQPADMVKFAKDGSTVITAAVKLARAYTGRKRIVICADHPFFSYNDWFIGTTPVTGGIPDEEVALTSSFKYNDLASLQACFDRYPGEIACVLMEAAKGDEPKEGFLQGVQNLCRSQDAVFIIDEMITGFRWHLKGAQHVYGIQPDLCAFGKSMANGFALSALAGRKEIMELGGLYHDKERVFLLSTTHGAENHALAAATKTMEVYQSEPVIEHLYQQGEQLRSGIVKIIQELKLEEYVSVDGRPCNLTYATRGPDGKPSQEFRTLFLQEIIRRGIIAPSFVLSYSHGTNEISQTIEVVGEALQVYRRALDDGIDKYLTGRSVKSVYRKFN